MLLDPRGGTLSYHPSLNTPPGVSLRERTFFYLKELFLYFVNFLLFQTSDISPLEVIGAKDVERHQVEG